MRVKPAPAHVFKVHHRRVEKRADTYTRSIRTETSAGLDVSATTTQHQHGRSFVKNKYAAYNDVEWPASGNA